MTKEERQRQREAAWALPKTAGTPELTAHQEREAALAQLIGTPGWEALKSYLREQTRFRIVETTHPNWTAATAMEQGKTQFGLDVLKLVEGASERVKRHQKPAGSA